MSKFQIRAELVAVQVGDELVVYDSKLQAAHSLSADAAELFQRLKEGKELEHSETNLAILSLFAEKKILEDSDDWSRRDFLSGAIKAATIPLIASVALPVPAAAQSGAGVSEADCELSGGASCGQPCTGFPIGTRVCGSITGLPGGACGCVPTPAACSCT